MKKKSGRYFYLLGLSIFFMFIQAPAVRAGKFVNMNELSLLVQQQQRQIEEQRVWMQKQQRRMEAMQKVVQNQQQQLDKQINDMNKKNSQVKVSLKKGVKFASEDGDFSFRLGGRIHVDFAFYDEDKTKMGNGACFRRARLFTSGRLFKDWVFRSEIDFTEDNKVGPRDVWLGYTGLDRFTLKIGNFIEPFSLEEMTSSNVITFMERALPNAFAPNYHIGIGAGTYGDNWCGSAGFFGETLGSKDDNVDDGWAFAGRFAFVPYHSKNRAFHLGLATEYRETDTENNVRFRSRPESYVTNRRLVDTRMIHGVDSSLKVGCEFAGIYGPLSLQGEYISTMVDRQEDDDLCFDGWYIYGSWFITGESRRYLVKHGKFGSIQPVNSYGAWELGIRYSVLNLIDRDITGGKENDLTLGLNWYPNANIRIMANYIRANVHPNRNGKDENLNIFQMRAQFSF